MSRRAALVVSEGTNGVGRGGGANVRLKPGAGDNIDRAVEQAGYVLFQSGVIEDGDVRGRIKLLGTSAHRGAHLEPQSGLDHACDTAIRIAGVIRSFADRRTAAIWVDRMPKGFPNDLARVARRKLRMNVGVSNEARGPSKSAGQSPGEISGRSSRAADGPA